MQEEKRRFVSAYLRCFDAEAAAQAAGKTDGVKLLSSPVVQKELELQRGQCLPGGRTPCGGWHS